MNITEGRSCDFIHSKSIAKNLEANLDRRNNYSTLNNTCQFIWLPCGSYRDQEVSSLNYRSPAQKRLLGCLGKDYSTTVIDGVLVIYRDYGAHDVEVSGGYTDRQRFGVYVWQKDGGLIIVDRYQDLPQNPGQIRALLDEISERYAKEEDENHG